VVQRSARNKTKNETALDISLIKPPIPASNPETCGVQAKCEPAGAKPRRLSAPSPCCYLGAISLKKNLRALDTTPIGYTMDRSTTASSITSV
jgi:hypothetical protein